MTENNETTDTPPEIQEKRDAIDQQVEGNRVKLHRLQREGIQLDGGELLERRVETLVEFLLGGADSEQRLDFELLWHQNFEKILDNVREQVNKAKLTRGTAADLGAMHTGNGKLEIPGRG